MTLQRICVYLGSSPGRSTAYTEAAVRLARTLAARGLGLVYGGASVGTMGVLADAALDAGAEVIGVIPESLQAKELGHTGLTELHVVSSMHERKMLMMDLADGFVALPGGSGTLEELFETFTWLQLGLHRKPVGLLDVEGYWERLIQFIDDAEREGFIRPEHARMLLDEDDPDRLLDEMAAWSPPALPKWVDRDDT